MKEKLLNRILRILSLNIVILLLVLVSGIDSKILLLNGNKEIIFISSTVVRTEEFEKSLPGNAEIVYLSGQKNGIVQITEYLSERKDIDAMRIISHGNAGYFDLDGEMIDSKYIAENGDTFREWGKALSEDADIMLYGCKVAAAEEGKALVRKLAELTGADVAAATEVVGGLLANWTLDYKSGNIETTGLKIEDYEFHLQTTRTVNSNIDDDDDGSSETTTLREAIAAASSGDNIVFQLGTGNETIKIEYELWSLPILYKSLTIDGDNAAGSGTNITISGDNKSAILSIVSSASTVTLSNLKMINGNSLGKAVHCTNTNLTINNCTISNNYSVYGGAIFVESDNGLSFQLNNSTISNNSAADGTSIGGGLNITHMNCVINNSTISGNTSNFGGGISINQELSHTTTFSINNSTINGNTATTQGGGINLQNAIGEINNCTITGNIVTGAEGKGGGIYRYDGASCKIFNSTILGNSANQAGGIYTQYEDLYLKNSIIANNTNYDIYKFVNEWPVRVIDNGYNIIKNSSHADFSASSILYNTRYGSSSTDFTAWSQGGTVLSNQNLNIGSSLADNGGPTQTLAINKGSFAIGAGVYDATLITDQRGEDRHSLPTIGAYEPDYSVWEGDISTDWSETANWEFNWIPDPGYDVFIPNVSNNPVVSSSVMSCNDLIFYRGVSFH